MSSPLVDVFPSEPVALPSPGRTAAPSPRTRRQAPRWLSEPLLHFVVLGGLLFALDHYLIGKADDPQLIVVGAEVNSEAVHTFERARGRKPNELELKALHRVWLDNEILYREGLAMGVDKGDPAIRERVIFKMLSVVDNNTKVAPATDDALREWFETHRDKYDEPARYDFEEAALSGNASEATVREFVQALNAGTPGDAKAGLRVFKGRPRSNLVESYGLEFAKRLEQATPREWQALETRDGWRAIRLIAISAPRPAAFDAVRGPVLHDFADARGAEQRTEAVRALGKKYKVRFDDAHECEAD